MKTWLLSVILALLLVGTAVNGGLLWQTNADLNNTTADLSALESTNTTLQATLDQQQSQTAALQASINALQTAVSNPGTATVETDFTKLVLQIEPSVVYIEVSDRFGPAGSGSGTIIRSDGFILTNQHVIDGATAITVRLMTGETFSATVVVSSADLDLAVLKPTSSKTNLPAVTIGSSAAVVVGGEIITCGFPLGDELPGPATFNTGIVSAIRNMISQNTLNSSVKLDYIQMDADINPGNSGGGMFNQNGELIGVPAYGYDPGINFAIPIDAALNLIQSAYTK